MNYSGISAEEKIELLKDKARELSKTTSHGYQKNLDLIAEKFGFKNWANLLKLKDSLHDHCHIKVGIKKSIKLHEKLEATRKEYNYQDSMATAFPICCVVQSLEFVGIFSNESNANCIILPKYTHYLLNNSWETTRYEKKDTLIRDLKLRVEEDKDENLNLDQELVHIKKVNSGYVWTDIEFFLTNKAANEFAEKVQHKYYRLRTFIKHINYSNNEMGDLLYHLGFRSTSNDNEEHIFYRVTRKKNNNVLLSELNF